MLCHLVVSGFVQGVGYRQFTKKTALGLGLKGWVKNIDGGGVEALFSGEKEIIAKAIEICRQGSFLAEVKDIKVEWARLPAPTSPHAEQAHPQASEAQADGGQGEAVRERSDGGQEDKDMDFNSFEIVI